MVEMGRLYLGFSLPMMDERFIMVDFKSISLLKKKEYFKISYSFSRGYRSITRFSKHEIRKSFENKFSL